MSRDVTDTNPDFTDLVVTILKCCARLRVADITGIKGFKSLGRSRLLLKKEKCILNEAPCPLPRQRWKLACTTYRVTPEGTPAEVVDRIRQEREKAVLRIAKLVDRELATKRLRRVAMKRLRIHIMPICWLKESVMKDGNVAVEAMFAIEKRPLRRGW